MADVQDVFHKVLTVVFTKVQYLYFRRNLSVSSIRVLPLSSYTCFTPVLMNRCGTSQVPLHFCLYKKKQISMWRPFNEAKCVLTFWRTSCLFQKGQSSRTASRNQTLFLDCVIMFIKLYRWFLSLRAGLMHAYIDILWCAYETFINSTVYRYSGPDEVML